MNELLRSEADLRFFGDDLDPDEITHALGGLATVGVRKGGVWTTSAGKSVAARHGFWRLEARPCSPGDLSAQVEELFAGLSTDLAIWNALAARFQADIFCGLFLRRGGMGATRFAPRTLAEVGSRGLELDLAIYGFSRGRFSAEDLVGRGTDVAGT